MSNWIATATGQQSKDDIAITCAARLTPRRDIRPVGRNAGTEMKRMGHNVMGMSKARMDSLLAGTHHMMVEVTDPVMGTNLAGAGVEVAIASGSLTRTTPFHYGVK